MLDFLSQYYNYIVCVLLMMLGLYIVMTRVNLVKKLIGMSVFQVSVLLFYISMAYIPGTRVPLLDIQDGVAVVAGEQGEVLYTNPLPHVLMLTAIVVGVAVLAVGLALVVRIKRAYGTIEEKDLLALETK